jgi:hypothetical protein
VKVILLSLLSRFGFGACGTASARTGCRTGSVDCQMYGCLAPCRQAYDTPLRQLFRPQRIPSCILEMSKRSNRGSSGCHETPKLWSLAGPSAAQPPSVYAECYRSAYVAWSDAVHIKSSCRGHVRCSFERLPSTSLIFLYSTARDSALLITTTTDIDRYHINGVHSDTIVNSHNKQTNKTTSPP